MRNQRAVNTNVKRRNIDNEIKDSKEKNIKNKSKKKVKAAKNKERNLVPAITIISVILFFIIIACAGINLRIFNGVWNRNNVKYVEEGKLKITNETVSDLCFTLVTIVNNEEKVITGVAKKDMFIKAKYKEDGIDLVFERKAKGINVKSNASDSKLDIKGEYIKGKPVYLDIDKYTKIFPTEEIQKQVKELLQDKFYSFRETVYGALFEEFDYDLNGKSFEITLSSEKKSTLIIVTDTGKMYIGFNENGKTTYYTNDIEYKKDMPNKIKVWSESRI
ncbi:MAG: hypothetical protein RR810_03355 [Clostridia bacterium]